ncbi:hypothetical protein BDV98DRAFT_529211 [Pterulicium gracile]|uniref:NAD(P)-binding protein n=1 Tax=Pterulicium gracile TaxID=1884261 RepID=A0A5C3QT06_9AGAR|nr:hypothetical protein BDV98DRAFT_529211 [Pterula gracilis]
MDKVYQQTRQVQPDAKAFHENTVARLEKIRSHLDRTPRGTRLQGKVCVITGVNSLKGIGRASAMLYAHEGARHLYLMDFTVDNLPELKATIEKQYPDTKVTTLQGDAADEPTISGVCERALKEEGRLDVFFANAGIATKDILNDITPELFMNTMRINALSCLLAVKHASKAMLHIDAAKGKPHSSGSIILTASTAGIRSGAGTVDYSASKAAVNSIAQTSAYQLQKTNIRVNSLCPGLIETGMTEFTFDYARSRGSEAKIGQLNPLGRYGVALEIAQGACFLASDDSSYVNGQNFAIDGGLSASHPVMPGRWA